MAPFSSQPGKMTREHFFLLYFEGYEKGDFI